jgi:2-polyprenyl-3-methyl-5-hydroxy-6-metoxy-1,4-benzoquinol methylase
MSNDFPSAHTAQSESHRTLISDYYLANRNEIIQFMRQFGVFPSAIDIGCAAGELGKSLLAYQIAASCDGIEPNVQAATLAKDKLRKVWHGRLDEVVDIVPWTDYDLIVMADVLEHVIDPWATLKLLQELTQPTCKLMVSVPNVRHYKVVLPLLFKGEFSYLDQGIMDRTHLHFFTKSSLLEMLAECGWSVLSIRPHMKSRYHRPYYPTRLIEPFVAVQYMVIAEKR